MLANPRRTLSLARALVTRMESFYRADYIDVYDRPPLCTNPPLLFSRNRFARWYTGGARFFSYRRNRMVSSAYWIWVVWSCEFTLLTCQAMVEANAFSDELMFISTSTWKEYNLRIYSDYKSYWRVFLFSLSRCVFPPVLPIVLAVSQILDASFSSCFHIGAKWQITQLNLI